MKQTPQSVHTLITEMSGCVFVEFLPGLITRFLVYDSGQILSLSSYNFTSDDKTKVV